MLVTLFISATTLLWLQQAPASCQLTPENVLEAVSNGAVLVDVRSGNVSTLIKGSQRHPLEGESISLPKRIAVDQQIILYCDTMRTSLKAHKLLTQRGYSCVSILGGGLQAWMAASFPVEQSE